MASQYWRPNSTIGARPSVSQIDSIYTELQPCGPIYHGCDKWLSNNMKDIPVTYSFDYGADKAGQTAGMNALRRALTQVRQGNLPK